MENITLILIAGFGILVLLLALVIIKLYTGSQQKVVEMLISKSEENANVVAKQMQDSLMNSRMETIQAGKDLRMEVLQQMATLSKTLAESQTNSNEMLYKQMNQFSEQMYQMMQTNTERHVVFQDKTAQQHQENRNVLAFEMDKVSSSLNETLKEYKANLRENFIDFGQKQLSGNTQVNERLAEMKLGLEQSIVALQQSNEQKLDQMRHIVDEKLSSTLEKRLGESYKLVSERLEAVHQGLGDMQNLALSVGDLKKVMSNVKSRGIIGEYQLQNILEDLLTNEQYGRNVKTKAGSGAMVEFAIKMPHGANLEKTLWLPVDAKFPREDFEALISAYDTANADIIDASKKAFANGIIKNARDIQEKYIDPPNTTEYGIMFLPFESLYAEVLCIPGLFEKLQKEYKITITGPTTLSALLNSLQMGFRTMAIEKRSAEVWDLLDAVKAEFHLFGNLLDKTRKKLDEAANVIDSAGIRSRAIQRKLNKVELLDEAPDNNLLMGGEEV